MIIPLTNSVSLYVGYSNSLHVPPAKGSVHLDRDTSADMIIIPAVLDLYQRCVDPNKSIRRVNISFNNLIPETVQRQLCFFDSAETSIKRKHQVQKTVIGIKKRYGNNSILKGTNFEPAATGRERNRQIGGHKSGE